jgi:hypothetical protein
MPPLAGSLGILAFGGTGSIEFALPPATDPALAGITVHHAAAVVPLPAFGPVQFTSNPAPLQLEP